MSDDPTTRKIGDGTPEKPGYRGVGDSSSQPGYRKIGDDSSAPSHRDQGDPGYRGMGESDKGPGYRSIGQPRPSSAQQRQESRESAPYVTGDFATDAMLNAFKGQIADLQAYAEYLRCLIPSAQTPAGCSDTQYSCGKKFTGLMSDPSKPFIVLARNPAGARQDAGPMGDSMPDDEEWYPKAQTFGSQHAWIGG